MSRAVAFLGVQLAVGLGVLLQLNWYRYVIRRMKQTILDANLIRVRSLASSSVHPPCLL
jgi:hypothetical protein